MQWLQLELGNGPNAAFAQDGTFTAAARFGNLDNMIWLKEQETEWDGDTLVATPPRGWVE